MVTRLRVGGERMTDQPINVLVVDDEPILCEISGSLLTDMNFHVLTATSCADAISILKHSRIDVVVTDVQMPNGSGIDLLHAINRMDSPRPAVFLVSAFTKLSPKDSHALGAVDLLDKPLDYDQLGQKIMFVSKQRRALAAKGTFPTPSIQP
jgi:DNA-binding NtrC family response regulator